MGRDAGGVQDHDHTNQNKYVIFWEDLTRDIVYHLKVFLYVLGNCGDKDSPKKCEAEEAFLSRLRHVSSPELDLQRHLQMGLQLCKALEKLNRAVGKTILNSFVTRSISAILTTYGSVTVLFCDELHVATVLFSLTHACLTLLFLAKLYVMTSTGHRLIVALDSSRTLLEDFVINNSSEVFPRVVPGGDSNSSADIIAASSADPAPLQFTVDVLRGRLDGSRGGISPLSFFTLSKVGFASGLGTVVTYIIVLMQFKATE